MSDQEKREEPCAEPRCSCGGIWKFLAKLPAVADLPEITIFECAECGIVDYLRGATDPWAKTLS